MNFRANPFEGMTSGDQSVGERLPFLDDGDYKLRIQKTVIRGRDKPYFISELEILDSNVPTRPKGMRCVSFVADLTNASMRGKNIAGYITAVFGFDPAQLPKDSVVAPWIDPSAGRNVSWGEYAPWVAGEENPFAGREVGCRVRTILTQETKSEFSQHIWVPIQMMVIPPHPHVSDRKPKSQAAPAGAPGATPGAWGPPGGPAQHVAPGGGPWQPPGQGTPPPGQPQPGGQPAPFGGAGYPQGAPPAGAPPAGPGPAPWASPPAGFPQPPQGAPQPGQYPGAAPAYPQPPQGQPQWQGQPAPAQPQQPAAPGQYPQPPQGGNWGPPR